MLFLSILLCVEMPSKQKIEKYQDLKREMTRLWNTTTYVVPVVEVLGMIPKNLKQHLEATSVFIKVEL